MSRSIQDRRNDLNRAVFFLRAKARCRGHALGCFLDEEPSALVPRGRQQGIESPGHHDRLVVNASLRYQPRGGPPPELLRRGVPLDGLLPGVPLAWIKDPGTALWAPFWARGEWVRALESLRPGQPAPSALPPAVRRILAMANVLVAPGYEEEREAAWERTCRDAGAQFRAEGYAIVRDVLHPLHIGALRRYYRALVGSGRLPRGDDQVAARYRLHSEPVAMFFLPQLAALVSQIAGEPVQPSYAYFSCYPSGSALPRHLDREQCEFSISLLVDYAPDPDGPCGWPLYLEDPGWAEGRRAVDLAVGDAALYRGRELVHYRDTLPEGHQSTSLFFHYVREDYTGDLF